jgi:hypothetical protein
MFAHFRDMVESRGGSRWWNTNFAENAHVGTCKTTYRSGNKQVATLQTQLASTFERRRVMHGHAVKLGVDQDYVRRPGPPAFAQRAPSAQPHRLRSCRAGGPPLARWRGD